MNLDPGPVTVHHVAAKAKVSIATVSRVIAEKPSVLPETAKRVRLAMSALGYEPNRNAQSLRSQRTHNIGIVLPHFHNQFFFQLIEHAVLTAQAAGYSVVIAGAEDAVGEANRLAGSRLVDGLVVVAASSRLASQSPYVHQGVPVVAFDRAPENLRCPVFQVDNRHGARAVAAHLAQTGATRIAHISGPPTLEVAQLREEEYRRSLEDAGLGVHPELIVRGDFTEASGARAMEQLLALNERPDAVFAANDLMALGALGVAAERGLGVPRDIRIAGFDDITAASFTVPKLTTYAQPIRRMALASVDRVVSLIEGGHSYGDEADRVLLRGDLKVRASTNKEEIA